MNIIIDIRSLLDKQYSGVGEYCFHIVDALLKNKKNNFSLFFNNWKQLEIPRWQSQKYHLVDGHFPNKVFNVGQYLFNSPQIDTIVHKRTGLQSDVILVPNHNFYSVSRDCASVVVVHDISFVHYPSFFSKKERLWHYLVNTSQKLHSADHIVAISQTTKDDIMRVYGIQEKKISVVPLGVSHESSHLDESKMFVKNKYHLPEKFCLFVGTVEPRKNVLSIIRAYEKLRNETTFPHHLLLVGKAGYGSTLILDYIKKSKFRDSIRILGYVQKDERSALYASADILLYPSFYEGFGLPPLEAAVVGTPVITSNVSAVPEVNKDSVVLVNPYDIADIVCAMKALLSDSLLVKSLCHKARMNSLQYSWDAAASAIVAIMESVSRHN